jgi:hypothetical protein
MERERQPDIKVINVLDGTQDINEENLFSNMAYEESLAGLNFPTFQKGSSVPSNSKDILANENKKFSLSKTSAVEGT